MRQWIKMKNGFTLIELLSVIVIIAILAAILFPVFNEARQKAKAQQCVSNEKQIGEAMLQYTEDYDDWMPFYQSINGSGATVQFWPDMIYPYIKSTAVFNCPSDLGQAGDTASFTYGYCADRSTGSCSYPTGDYGINAGYRTDQSPPHSVVGDPRYPKTYITLSALVAPADTIWVADDFPYRSEVAGFASSPALSPIYYTSPTTGPSCSGNGGAGCTSSTPVWCTEFPMMLQDGSNAGGVVFRHQGMANVLWCDGHVKACTTGFLSQTSPTYPTALRWFIIEDD